MHNLASLLLSSRLRHFRELSISVTLEVFRCLFLTYLAALRCTISSFCTFAWVWGSHTVLAYSTKGHTMVKYALSLMEVPPLFRFRLRKPIVRLALSQMLLWQQYHTISYYTAKTKYNISVIIRCKTNRFHPVCQTNLFESNATYMIL